MSSDAIFSDELLLTLVEMRAACGFHHMLCVRLIPPSFQSNAQLTYQDSVTAQVFVVVAAGSVIAFIIRDLGEASLAGWIIQVSSIPLGADGREPQTELTPNRVLC
jgi:hypothetical protein